MSHITKSQADEYLRYVQKRFHAVQWGGDGPALFPPGQGFMEADCWSITWEDGPYDWSYEMASTDLVVAPAVEGVWTEPYNSFVLHLYPVDSLL